MHKEKHAKGKVPFIPDYTTINTRINKFDLIKMIVLVTKNPKYDEISIGLYNKVSKEGKQRSRVKRQIEKKEVRLFENSYSSRHQEQKNNFNKGN